MAQGAARGPRPEPGRGQKAGSDQTGVMNVEGTGVNGLYYFVGEVQPPKLVIDMVPPIT